MSETKTSNDELEALLDELVDHATDVELEYERGANSGAERAILNREEAKAKITALFQRQAKEATQREKYQAAINKIDDYFEYRNESQQDKEFVRGVLGELCDGLKASKDI